MVDPVEAWGAESPFFIPAIAEAIATSTGNPGRYIRFEGLTVQQVTQLEGDHGADPAAFEALATFCAETEDVRTRLSAGIAQEQSANTRLQAEKVAYDTLLTAYGEGLAKIRSEALESGDSFANALMTVEANSQIMSSAHAAGGKRLLELSNTRRDQLEHFIALLEVYSTDLVYHCRSLGLNNAVIMGQKYTFEHGVLVYGQRGTVLVYGSSSTAGQVYQDRRDKAAAKDRSDIKVRAADLSEWAALLSDFKLIAQF